MAPVVPLVPTSRIEVSVLTYEMVSDVTNSATSLTAHVFPRPSG